MAQQPPAAAHSVLERQRERRQNFLDVDDWNWTAIPPIQSAQGWDMGEEPQRGSGWGESILPDGAELAQCQ